MPFEANFVNFQKQGPFERILDGFQRQGPFEANSVEFQGASRSDRIEPEQSNQELCAEHFIVL